MAHADANVCTGVKRGRVVQAVLAIIAAGGVNALTVATIATKSGVSKTTLYRLFKNKEGILDETVEKIGAELMINLDYIYDSDPTVIISLKRFFLLHLDYIKTNKGIVRLVFSGDVFKTSAELQEKVSDVIDTYTVGLAALIEKGKRTGTIGQAVDPAAAALMLIGMVLVMTIKWSLSGFSFPLVEMGMKQWHNYEKHLTAESLQLQRQ